MINNNNMVPVYYITFLTCFKQVAHFPDFPITILSRVELRKAEELKHAHRVSDLVKQWHIKYKYEVPPLTLNCTLEKKCAQMSQIDL